MPNQANFRSDVTTPTDIRYLASRIVKVPSETIFVTEMPGSFGYDPEDNIEIHFYTIPDNQLLLSLTARLTDDIIKSHVVSYADGTYKNYIRLEFTKLFDLNGATLLPGDYRMVINFFSDEIGSYGSRNLTIETITESRTEVELTFNNNFDDATVTLNNNSLFEFVEPSFERVDAVGVAEKIFKSGVELNDSTEGLTSTNVLSIANQNAVNRITQIGQNEKFRQEVNKLIVYLYDFIAAELVKGDERIQQNEFQAIITSVVNKKLQHISRNLDARINVT